MNTAEKANKKPRFLPALPPLSSSSLPSPTRRQAAAMATSPIHDQPSDPNQIDRLSNLPDELLVTILSFLPTHVAARTSVLCRRLRHLCEALWETSPSLELISRDFPNRETSAARFKTMADRILLRRSPSHRHPLLSLRLELSRYRRYGERGSSDEIEPFLSSLLIKARSLGVRHLTLEGCWLSPTCSSLALVFSINSLESLSLCLMSYGRFQDAEFPSAATLTNLKNLFLQKWCGAPAKLNLFLSQLCSLHDLSLKHAALDAFSLSSQTVRKLKLIIDISTQEHYPVDLSLPFLELLHVENDEILGFPCIRGDIPLLRKAVLNLSRLRKTDCSAIAGLLNSISHTEELVLHIKEHDAEMYPFPILLEPGNDPPRFPNLKHLDATMCFHKHNFEAIVAFLHHSPALESLKLVHKVSLSNYRTCDRNKDDWRSMLPCNVYYTNLHLGQHSNRFMKLLGKQCTRKVVE